MGTAKDYVRVAYRKSSRTAEAERLQTVSVNLYQLSILSSTRSVESCKFTVIDNIPE